MLINAININYLFIIFVTVVLLLFIYYFNI